MNNERREKIIKDHPKLFTHVNYFECQDGWLGIIEKLSDSLEPLIEDWIKKNPEEAKDCYPCCSQVKEKYGSLHFYMSTETDEMSRLITEAETESCLTCEICGNPGRIRGEFWYSTTCDDHAER